MEMSRIDFGRSGMPGKSAKQFRANFTPNNILTHNAFQPIPTLAGRGYAPRTAMAECRKTFCWNGGITTLRLAT
jgi:hypothetical protein